MKLDKKKYEKNGSSAVSEGYDTTDTFVEDFLMTHIIFLPVAKLCLILSGYFKMLDNAVDVTPDISINNKKKVGFFC